MEVINHAAPTDWMRLPKFDTRLAIHTFRKIGVWNGEDDSRSIHTMKRSKMQGFRYRT